MTTSKKICCFVGASILILGLGFILHDLAGRPGAHVTLGCLSISKSTNTCLISVGITNKSHSTIVYSVGAAQAQSNGVWNALNAFRFPPGKLLVQLPAGASTNIVVETPSVSGESRVPVLWGFTYSPTATRWPRWQEWREDAMEWLRMRNFRGHGALYTNYVTDIRL